MSRLKIMLILPHLGGGGAELVTAQLANSLDVQKFDVSLILLTQDAIGAKTPPERIRVFRMNASRVRFSAFKLLRLIWQIRPNVLLSNMYHLNCLVLLIKLLMPRDMRIIVRQNTTASIASDSQVLKILYRCLYPSADRIVCQTSAMANDLKTNFGITPAKLAVLANPVDVDQIRSQARIHRAIHNRPPHPGPWPKLLTIGRLAREKGLDLLLQSLSLMRLNYPHIRLEIVGSGPEETSLREICERLDLYPHVHFAGYQSDPSRFYDESTLFVLPSRHEGMPNALLEAAAAGLPIVACPCCQGVIDLLEESPGVWLASSINVEALTEAVLLALNQLHFASEQRFNHAFLTPFELKTAIGAYERFLSAIATGAPP